VTSERPAIRVNQVGYLPGRPKRATWVTTRAEPAVFEVRTDRGATVHRGETEPWPQRPDPTSGAAVHVIDFGGLADAPGTCRIHVDGQVSHPFPVADGLYAPLGRDALAVFYLLRSGCAIDEVRAPGYGRPAGHVGDTAVPGWTGPDARRLYPDWQPVGRTQRRRRRVRRMPLAARLDAAHAGSGRPAVPGHGVPPGARHRVVADTRLGARGPDNPGAAPAVDRCDAASRGDRRRGCAGVREP
jgi:hypothetical protein